MTAYDKKSLRLSHDAPGTVHIVAEVDVDGTGVWIPYRTFAVEPSGVGHVFPEEFGAYWIRFRSDRTTTATAELVYE